MERINITEYDEYEGRSRLIGWFDLDKATRFSEDQDWNGSNHISVNTGSEWDHQTVYRTAQGRWALRGWSNRQGVQDTWGFISDADAREWLLRNGEDAAVAKYFGEVEEERGPGRPAIGSPVQIRVEDDLLAALDAWAAERGITRAEAGRRLMRQQLVAERPYAVTCLDVSTLVRETQSRHATLGEAVEALREMEADDHDSRQHGLPSCQPRIEHDGLQVDLEADDE